MKKLTFTLIVAMITTGFMFGQLSGGGNWMRSDKQIPADWSAEYTQEFVEIFHVSHLANGLDTSATDWYTALDEVPTTYTFDHFNENKDPLRKPADAADLSAEVGFVYDADAVWGIVKVTDDVIESANETLEIFYSSYPDSLPYAMYQEFDTFTDFSLAPKSGVAYWSRFGGGQIIWAGVLNNPSFDGVKWTLASANGSYAGNEINAGFKAAQPAANDYYMVFSLPFDSALNNLDPIANPDTAMSIELKVIDKDTGKDDIQMTLASDSNQSWITMIYNARATFSGEQTGIGSYTNTLEVGAFPNPTTGMINVKNAHLVERVTISNILGQTVGTINNFEGTTVDMSALETGLYLVNFEGREGSKAVKILKK